MSRLAISGVALLLGSWAAAQPTAERWQRIVTPAGYGDVCAVLDPAVFAHAAPSLKDLRLFGPAGEVPYAVTVSESAEPEGESARIVGVRAVPGGLLAQFEMPQRKYTEVVLDMAGKDFTALATVDGTDDLRSRNTVKLGVFSVFDLSTRGLGRNTAIALQESGFRFLRIGLQGPGLAPGMVTGAEVPPSREAQTIFSPVARAEKLEHRGGQTVATFALPAHVPVERVTVSSASRANFSRAVRVTARGENLTEIVDSGVMRVHLGRNQAEKMRFAASLGVNLQHPAIVEVAVADGPGAPVSIDAVTLEMRERRICFRSPGAPVTLLYGDPALPAPAYPYQAPDHPAPASLGPEAPNPGFREPLPPIRSRANSGLVGVGVLALVGLIGTFLLRLMHRRHE